MKKLTALIATAAMLIVGSVYAYWTYATGKVAQTRVEVSPQLTTIATDTPAAGVVTIAQAPTVTIDDLVVGLDGEGYDHVAEVYWNKDLIVNFESNIGADASVDNYGIPFEMKIYIPSKTYNGKEIFRVESGFETIYSPVFTSGDDTSVAKSATAEDKLDKIYGTIQKVDGVFVWTIAIDEFKTFIEFNEDQALSLPTQQDHSNFAGAISGSNIVLFIGQKGNVTSAQGQNS
jgi:hypothetical protein